MSYDSTQDVMDHKAAVEDLLMDVAACLEFRARGHDDSKLEEPEKSMFDQWVPELKARQFGSPEYMDALREMGEGLKHHYKNNRHHPEYHELGISGMNLLDLIEMVCDWCASANAKGNKTDITYQQKRFNLDPQLVSIIENTIKILENRDE
jgi:hypothetical protein